MTDFAKLIQQSKDRHDIMNRERVKETDPTGIPGKQFTAQASITPAGADYAVKFGYDAALLKKFKDAISESDRAWHKGRRVWLVAPEAIEKAKTILEAHTQTVITLPELQAGSVQILEKTFLLEYLGTTKDRGKRTSAYGSVNSGWSAEFPEDVLKNFFEKRESGKPDGLQTLYQVLCIFESAADQEIKSAYRRLARQWHPDVCQEDNATEMFRKLDEAYKVLSNPDQKRRYDAGLYFERQGQDTEARVSINHKYGYRAPLRCGQITARGTIRLMRFVVSEILKWDDVINTDGKVMLSQWPKGADTFQILWV